MNYMIQSSRNYHVVYAQHCVMYNQSKTYERMNNVIIKFDVVAQLVFKLSFT